MSKPKYPGINLNKVPTNNDAAFGKIAAQIAVEHQTNIARGIRDGTYLSIKIAAALKKFRTGNRKLTKNPPINPVKKLFSSVNRK